MSDKIISASDVAEHKTPESAWTIIEGAVYDVTEFLDDHPGGKKILLNSCGKDSTAAFWKFHNKKILDKTALRYKVGTLSLPAKL